MKPLSAPGLRLGLLARTGLALAAVGLLPLAISYFGLMDVNRDALFDQVTNTHALAARTASAQVGAFLETRLSLAQGAAGSAALADPRSPEAQDLLVRSLGAWAGLGVKAVAVVNAEGEEVVRAQLKGAAAANEALRLPGNGEVMAVPGSRPLLLRISAPLSGGADGIGWLRLACDGSALAEAVQPQELGVEAELVLADRSGRVVLGGSASKGGNSLAAFPPALIEQALPGRSEGAGRYRDRSGAEVLGAYSPVAGTDWVVLSRQPARVAEAVAGKLRRQSLLALGAALLLIAGLSAAAWFAVVRPVRELAAAQRELAGAGGVRGGIPAGRNEIEDLRRGFEALRRGIVERRALDNVFLGRYQVLELLATGGMGSVFRGWDPRLQRPVALKTLRLVVDLPEETRRSRIEQLVREAVTAARFSHPNVVAVYDVENVPEGAFIAMELVEGISLERLLLRRGRLAPGEVVPLGAAIARGLAAAHAREIVHRDVKPANVMLGRDGSVKVTDFGIADLVAAASQIDDRVFGTPGYLPPESLRGQGQGRAGDLFALGVMLYECLSGSKPFGGLESSDVVQATLFGTVRPLQGRGSEEIPAELESIVLLLLERDPVRRPADAAAVAEEMERMAAARGLRWKLDEGGPRPAASEPEVPSLTVEAQWVPTMAVLEPAESVRRVR